MIIRIGRLGYPCPEFVEGACATANEAHDTPNATTVKTVALFTMRLPSSLDAARAAPSPILPRGAGIQPGAVR
jgi:hypothetical protein